MIKKILLLHGIMLVYSELQAMQAGVVALLMPYSGRRLATAAATSRNGPTLYGAL
jgi:hypothetical protein